VTEPGDNFDTGDAPTTLSVIAHRTSGNHLLTPDAYPEVPIGRTATGRDDAAGTPSQEFGSMSDVTHSGMDP
jgi:hypothetical protein